MIEGWKKIKFGQICKVQGGFAFQSSSFTKNSEGIAVIKIGDIQNGIVMVGEKTSRVPYEFLKNKALSKYLLRENDILIALTGATIGKIGRVRKECGICFVNQRVGRFLPIEGKTTSTFIEFLSQTSEFQKNINDNILLSAQGNISPSKIEDIEVNVPPLPEQRKIAYILSTVQKAIEQQDKLIRTTTELKKALMQKLFTEGIGWLSGAETRQKQTEIGPVPEDWEVVRIGNVFKFSSGKPRPKNTIKERNNEFNIPVYGGNGILGYTNVSYLNKSTLILGRVGEYCGCTHLTEQLSWISDNALYAKEQFRDVDLFFIKNCFEWMNLNQYSNKMGQPLITQGIINEVKFGLPSLQEQKEIALVMERVYSKLEFHEKKKQTLSALFKTLLHELMTGQRRVHEIEFENRLKEEAIHG